MKCPSCGKPNFNGKCKKCHFISDVNAKLNGFYQYKKTGIITIIMLSLLLAVVATANATPNYSRTFNGSTDHITITDKPYLNTGLFTLSVWFQTSKVYSPNSNGGEGMMITKGGWISNKAGEQLSYGIWISDANHLRGGFETKAGVDNILTTSGTTFNDGKWHMGTLTYDKVKLRLYADGVLFKELATTAIPENNNQPLDIGKNPLTYRAGYFKGNLDDVYVWNTALTASDVANLYTNNQLSHNSRIVYSNSFGGFSASSNTIQTQGYNFGPSLPLDGGQTQNGATIK